MNPRIRQQGLDGGHRYSITPSAVTRQGMTVDFTTVRAVASSAPGVLLVAIELDLGADPGITDATTPWRITVPQLSGLSTQGIAPSTLLDGGDITIPATATAFNSRLSIRGMVI